MLSISCEMLTSKLGLLLPDPAHTRGHMHLFTHERKCMETHVAVVPAKRVTET